MEGAAQVTVVLLVGALILLFSWPPQPALAAFLVFIAGVNGVLPPRRTGVTRLLTGVRFGGGAGKEIWRAWS